MEREIIYYTTRSGRSPVDEFLDRLQEAHREAVEEMIGLLGEMGHTLRRPHVDYLKNKIYELRIKEERTRYRVLYFFWHEGSIVLTHGFIKKTKKVPLAEIKTATRFRKDWILRNG